MNFEDILRIYEENNPATGALLSNRMNDYFRLALQSPEYARIVYQIISKNYLIEISDFDWKIFPYLDSFMKKYRTLISEYGSGSFSDPSIFKIQVKNLTPKQSTIMVNQLGPNLKQLSINSSEVENSMKYLSERFPSHLERLSILDSFIGNEGFKLLTEALPETLIFLELRDNGITIVNENFSLPQELKAFKLIENKIGDEGAIIIGRNLPKSLKLLFMSNDNIADLGVESIAQHLPFDFLQLDLGSNNIGDEGAIALSRIIKPPREIRISDQNYVKNLIYLGLGINNNIKSRGTRAIAQNLPANLQFLDLNYTEIDERGIEILSHNLPESLRFLYLNETGIDDKMLTILAPGLPSKLEDLDLSENNISDAGITELVKYLGSSLRILELEGNNIGDEGVSVLAQYLPSSLNELDLSENQISDKGAIELSKHLPPHLNILDLSENNIGDEGALELARKIRPPSVAFYVGGPITKEGIRRIRDDPDVKLKRININGQRYIFPRKWSAIHFSS